MADTTPTPDEQLLSDVEDYLYITLKDNSANKKVTEYITSSKARLQEIAGVLLDFTQPGLARDLLKDRCRYMHSQALEMFENNFRSELINLNLNNQFATPKALTVISAAGTSSGYTSINISPQKDIENSYVYKLGTGLPLPGYFDVCDIVCGYTAWNGLDEIQASAGDSILIVEVDENYKAIRAGIATVTVR